MVKADAYGLGAGPVVDALGAEPGTLRPWAFGVAAVREGEALRVHGWEGRILLFTPIAPGQEEAAARAGLTPSFSEVEGVRRWAALGERLGRRLPFHLEVDTGMGRAGLGWDRASGWGAAVLGAAGEGAVWEGCFTHFHSADEPDLTATEVQRTRFEEALAQLPAGLRRELIVHSANSAASLRCGGFGDDLVRPGIFLYGGGVGGAIRPQPVVSVRARVVRVVEVEAGATVGYGATHRAGGREVWGTLAIGYGDGIPRALATGGGEVLLRGERVPMIGRISMDMITVNLSALPAVRAGEVATLIGRDGAGEITVDEVAGRVGTISYEILTGLGARLPREYSWGEK